MYFYQTMKSPLGTLRLIADEDSLVALYTKEDLEIDARSPLKNMALKSLKHTVLLQAKKELDDYFLGKRKHFTVPLKPHGTVFQNKAWSALLKIPYGDIWSYGKQAQFLKKPKAQRAVGCANGKNPIPIIIPCHRVIGSSGKLTGYSGGMEMKIFLLRHEGHKLDTHGLKVI